MGSKESKWFEINARRFSQSSVIVSFPAINFLNSLFEVVCQLQRAGLRRFRHRYALASRRPQSVWAGLHLKAIGSSVKFLLPTRCEPEVGGLAQVEPYECAYVPPGRSRLRTPRQLRATSRPRKGVCELRTQAPKDCSAPPRQDRRMLERGAAVQSPRALPLSIAEPGLPSLLR